MPKITHERLLDVLGYDAQTGVFTWKQRMSNRIHVGDRAGVVAGGGRRFIMVDGEKFQAHRLAWFYENGRWPIGDLRQINGDYDDSSLGNLKEMSRIEAARSRGTGSTNTSGHKGISPHPKGGWKASVTCNYQQINLGVFPMKEDAIEMHGKAQELMSGAVTPEQCAEAAERIIQFRRKRVAWNRLERSGRPHVWESFEAFTCDVGSVGDDESTVAALDEALPAGPNNYRWLGRPKGEFDRSTKDGSAAYMRAYRSANPGRWRHSHLLNNYKINEVERGKMEKEQRNLCAICAKPETKIQDGKVRRLSVDHDKETGAIRALLCGNCNEGIGYLRHDPTVLRKAADYCEQHSKLEWSTPSLTEITHTALGQKLLQEAAGHG